MEVWEQMLGILNCLYHKTFFKILYICKILTFSEETKKSMNYVVYLCV